LSERKQTAADAGWAEVVAACALSAVPGLGATALARMAKRFEDSLTKAMKAGPEKLLSLAEELELRQPAIDFLRREPDLEELGLWAVAAAKAAGARVILLGDECYPTLLRQIENPPPLLYVRGHLQTDLPRIAVVGSREVDEQGIGLARKFGDGFARAGVQVISGGARGIDRAAHDGALWGLGSTVAVLGCGIDVTYPPEHGELFDRLSRGAGAVVSEFPPGTPPTTHNFPRRNRTISGLSSAVVVVRAAVRSGALVTADHAAMQKRAIFAVPGDVSNTLSTGTNALLRRGAAKPATSALDVLQGLEWPIPPELTEPPPDESKRNLDAGFAGLTAPTEPPRPDHEVIDEASLRLWRLLDERTPAHVDDLALRAQVSAQEALRKLAELELKGMCLQRPGKFFLRR